MTCDDRCTPETCPVQSLHHTCAHKTHLTPYYRYSGTRTVCGYGYGLIHGMLPIYLESGLLYSTSIYTHYSLLT